MKKCVLKITVFALLFVLISCSKNSESQNKNNPWIEEQVSVQDEETTSKLDNTSQNESEIQLTRKEDDGKDYTKEYFKDYFDDLITNYEFYIRNPLFVSNVKLFFEKPEMLKNKILKVTEESYEIAPDGNKNWGDSDEKDYSCDYYFFDSDFRITDSYYISRTEPGYYFTKKRQFYVLSKKSCFNFYLKCDRLYLSKGE